MTGLSAVGLAMANPRIVPCPADNSVVIVYLDADVTGDGVTDRVMLMGRRFDESSPYIVEMPVDVTNLDGRNELCTRLPEGSDSGYEPQLKAMDFTGDGVPDVFISSATGGSGGIMNYMIYSFKDQRSKLILDTSKTVIPKFTGRLLTNYKARVTVEGTTRIIDLKDRKTYYDQMGYYKKGKLLKPVDVWGGGYGLITPVDIDNNGIYELRTVQQVKGIANVDTIADIISILKYDNGKWKAASVEVKSVSD
jgi:hypothetical protein